MVTLGARVHCAPSDWTYCVEFLPPPPPPPVVGAVVPKKRYHWDDILEKPENDCPLGVVTFLVDAPLAVKDVSLPKTVCLVLLEPGAGTTPEVLLASQVLLDPDAETTPEVLLASQTLLEPDARTIACNRLTIELEELKRMV